MRWLPALAALVMLGGCDRFLGLTTQQLPDAGTCLGDNFDDNSIDTVRWNAFAQNGQTVIEQNQRLEIALASPAAVSFSGVLANEPLGHDEIAQVEVIQPATQAQTQVELQLYFDDNNFGQILQETNKLTFIANNAGVPDMVAIGFVASEHRFWRLQFTGTTYYFWTSRDGATWIKQHTVNAQLPGVPSTILAAGQIAVVPAPGIVALDNYEIVTAGCQL
ncbi:MAG TPA: hypothetical protein VLB44_19165 [Kofleriaceae bacterium]|nr:hypothetical protein [Kofleriaceae bacterium]